MIGRRRVLTIIAGGILAGRGVRAAEWRGRALGAEARILIRGGAAPDDLLAAVRAEIERIEAVFSLYRDSELSRLNRDRRGAPSPEMRAALSLARRVHVATGGAFDPGVQPLWRQLAEGGGPDPRALVPFAGLRQQGTELRLAPGQALTLNGIAQGIATDRVATLLAGRGLGQVLVDMGEARALEGDFALELADPAAGTLGRITLRAGRAVATSSPGALLFPSGQGHILGPRGQPPLWSTVSVEAASAALADAASTGFVLMQREAIRQAARRLGLGPVRLVDPEGGLSTLDGQPAA
ncbi:FAD:protein FMN transferase [Paracoccus marinaquae]|uniref:FAD:protein FMN transferase n=1 Tax=Paracoccus marinaquae TaxID=2841926 RepID=A0ABS6AGZ8_9RHOB|nr:FAD:protein FMN transferase [Paracoccus marinaquae]MBU3028914.1 FAD:protein FMN transferase [Paracoccus marinaquae]